MEEEYKEEVWKMLLNQGGVQPERFKTKKTVKATKTNVKTQPKGLAFLEIKRGKYADLMAECGVVDGESAIGV